MKDAIGTIAVYAFIVFFLYGVFSSAQWVYRGYQEGKQASRRLNEFLSRLPSQGFERLPPGQEEVQGLLDRYYVIRRRRTVELRATSIYRGTIDRFPAYVLITFERINVFGNSIGAGRQSSRSRFQGTMIGVRMPLVFPGRTMVYRRPAPGESECWDWFAEEPLLGSRAYSIEEGLTADFSKEFSVRSTDKTASVPAALQRFLLTQKDLFVGTTSHRSALVFDELGWGYVIDTAPDPELLQKVMVFQKEIMPLFAAEAIARK